MVVGMLKIYICLILIFNLYIDHTITALSKNKDLSVGGSCRDWQYINWFNISKPIQEGLSLHDFERSPRWFSVLFVNCNVWCLLETNWVQSNATNIPRPEMWCEREIKFRVLCFMMLINSNGFSSQFPVKKSIIVDYSLGS